jgi:glycine cleavage system aminomethyltransferase T/glycine/D-amino acid oxidase-like deaminating enzyme
MRNSPGDVVVIGAGIVGCSVAEHLTARHPTAQHLTAQHPTAQHLTAQGVRSVVVVDQGPLFRTGGSTSHAPGLVFQTNPSQTMSRLARYSVQKYGALRHRGAACFDPVGSIEVAASPGRWAELKRRHGLATSWGIESHLLARDLVARRVPLLDPARIHGGLFVPGDGLARAVWAAASMAGAAQERGARFVGDTEVTGIEVVGGRVSGVLTTAGRLAADLVVCCAGIWGPRIGRMAGVPVPLMPFQHQYVKTTPLASLASETKEARHPILRHQDGAMYFRQHRDRYGIGNYNHVPLPVPPEDILRPGQAPVMPSVLDFTPEDFKQAWADAVTLLPEIGSAEIEESFNGMFSFTPDGLPLIGESRSVRGFWLAEAVWITHAAGVGRAVAEWIATGRPGIDLRECDLHRFEPYATSPGYVARRGAQQYDEVYDIVHPQQPLEQPRPLRTSPWYPRQAALGAVFLEFTGWERPHWYQANSTLADDIDRQGRDLARPGDWAARYWSPMVAAEHLAARERVAIFDMTSLPRAEVRGRGALAFLDRLTTGKLDREPGYVTYALMLDETAGIRSDVTVARLAADRFQVGLNGARDIDYLERALPADGSVQVRDITGGTCCIGVWGPRARDVVAPLAADDFSAAGFGFFRCRETFIREVPVTALRLSYVGELGWELYTTADFGLRLWDLLWAAGQQHGILAAGRGAFTGMRLEKGYRLWGTDMWTEHDPDEAGVGFAVRPGKTGFVGFDALRARREAGPRRRLVCLSVDDGTVVMGKEPVYAAGEPVGFVTSAGYGYSVDMSIAFAWLPPELSAQGTAVEVEYFAERHPATVRRDPLFDPEMHRMRA